MSTIHIDQINLRCRGIPAATAEAALRNLGPALQQHFAKAGVGSLSAASSPAPVTVHVASGATSTALTAAIAGHVATVARAARVSPRNQEII